MNELGFIVIGYSRGGRLIGDWLADSLRSQHVHATRIASVAELDEPNVESTTAFFRESEAVVAVVGPEDAASAALFFDYGIALGLGKPFIMLVTDQSSVDELPEALRKGVQVMADTPDETARALLSSLMVAA